MTETQPGREPEQGAGPENEVREQVEDGIGYADPSAQIGLGTREPTDDLSPTGYLDPSGHSGLGSRDRPRPTRWRRGPQRRLHRDARGLTGGGRGTAGEQPRDRKRRSCHRHRAAGSGRAPARALDAPRHPVCGTVFGLLWGVPYLVAGQGMSAGQANRTS